MRDFFSNLRTKAAFIGPAVAPSALCLMCLMPIGRIQAQTSSAPAIFSIRLEQRKGSTAQAVPQNNVFRNGDILRFRLTSQIAGYLYVVDKGTSGEVSPLFPSTSAPNADNRIEMNRSYVVPADGDGWFQVDGPAGFDTIYFLVSSTPIVLPKPPTPGGQPNAPQPQAPPPPPPDLLPRCDDAIFKARGECLDVSAGVAPLGPDASVPRELIPLAKTASRDIVLTNDGDDTEIKPAPAARLPLIYTFRLAHRE